LALSLDFAAAMARRQHSFDTYALLQAAIQGDDQGVREALDAGADVNAVDAHGRTALTTAITGER
jgi:ankyrin repeat protein